MNRKGKLIAGICLLIGAAYAGFCLVTIGPKSYYVTALIVFTLLGLGLIRQSR